MGHPINIVTGEYAIEDVLNWFLNLKDSHQYLWRGHEVGDWGLIPSLGRYQVRGCMGGATASRAELRRVREKMLRRFFRDAVRHEFLASNEFPDNSEGRLTLEMLAQHFGLPTRLLDWSESFHTSMFFAYGGWSDLALARPCIWGLHRLNLEKACIAIERARRGRHPFKSDDEALKSYRDRRDGVGICRRDMRINVRIRRQRGWFTYMGSSFGALEQFVADNIDYFPDDTLLKITLKSSDQERAFKFLDDAGTVGAVIRADLEGVSKDAFNILFRFGFEKA